MRSLPLWSSLFVSVALAACGGGGDGGDDGVDVDAGPPSAFNCDGESLPTTSTDPVVVKGEMVAE